MLLFELVKSIFLSFFNSYHLNDSLFILAAVSALAKFGAASEDLLPNILVLLQRTMLDQDDEVRDRATFYYQLLKQNDKGLYSAYILNCKSLHVSFPLSILIGKKLLLAMNVSLSALERLLHRYTMESTLKPFDVRSVPVEVAPVENQKGSIIDH